MELRFRRIAVDEVEREITQRDQFDTDDVVLLEAFVRESHQNSLDALSPASPTRTVRTRIALHRPTADQWSFLRPLFLDLPGHMADAGLQAVDIDSAPLMIVFEDFGTTGLTGQWDCKDAMPFNDFWRRVGRSHKGGQQGGRWGLGKLVFSSLSKGRSFFGVTVREGEDGMALLMGQAVLSIRTGSDGHELDAHGFYCDPESQQLQLPVIDQTFVTRFCEAVGVTRRAEPGLSVVVPFVEADAMDPKGLLRYCLTNYYFPILTGALVCDVQGTILEEATFDAVASSVGGDLFGDGRLVSFVRDIDDTMNRAAPSLTLDGSKLDELQARIGHEALEKLRTQFAEGHLIHIRIPITLSSRKKGRQNTFLDVFLQRTEGHPVSVAVRGSITLPREAGGIRVPGALVALVANDPAVCEFLGDAENPSHTGWNGNAEKLVANWASASARLREMRKVSAVVGGLIAQPSERDRIDALIDVLSIPASSGGHRAPKKPVPLVKPVPQIDRKPRRFQVDPRKGGFTVRGTGRTTADERPVRIRVRVAYDVLRGSPFSRHDPLDFDLNDSSEVQLAAEGATVSVEAANTFTVDATDGEFTVSGTGFDANRDLVVDARAS